MIWIGPLQVKKERPQPLSLSPCEHAAGGQPTASQAVFSPEPDQVGTLVLDSQPPDPGAADVCRLSPLVSGIFANVARTKTVVSFQRCIPKGFLKLPVHIRCFRSLSTV